MTFQARANAASASLTNNKTNSTTTTCHFEDGNGYYQKLTNGSLTWDWIHNETSSVSRKRTRCIITDHLQAIRENRYLPRKPLVFLTLGDSLDRNIVLDHICAKWEGFRIFNDSTTTTTSSSSRSYQVHDTTSSSSSSLNTAPYNESTSGICTSPNGLFYFAFFKIYGMHHDCENNGLLRREDTRTTRSTADRVAHFLPSDVLSHLPKDSTIIVLAGSSLWDLSEGNCNNRLTISQNYQTLYRQGIIALHQVIQTRLLLLPRSSPSLVMYWRTSPAVSEEYNEMAAWRKWGRNRANQETLNAILRRTVAERELGVVVDWWKQANQRPESERGINRDGRHYEEGPSLAFYNMFLNAVFDHHPWLLE